MHSHEFTWHFKHTKSLHILHSSECNMAHIREHLFPVRLQENVTVLLHVKLCDMSESTLLNTKPHCNLPWEYYAVIVSIPASANVCVWVPHKWSWGWTAAVWEEIGGELLLSARDESLLWDAAHSVPVAAGQYTQIRHIIHMKSSP